MAWLESNHGRLLVGFRFRGERCREYLGLDDNRDNRRSAARIIKEIEVELAVGKLDYAARFPESPKLEHFGLAPEPRAVTPEVNQKPQAPTLGAFAESWLKERRIVLTVATAYGLRSADQGTTSALFARPETDRRNQRR